MKCKVVGNDGIACPRCGRPSQIREHKEITNKLLHQPFYYKRWYYCIHSDCQTRQFMSDNFKVLNNNSAARDYLHVSQHTQERQDQLGFLKRI